MDEHKVPARQLLQVVYQLHEEIKSHKQETEQHRQNDERHDMHLSTHEYHMAQHERQIAEWDETSKHLLSIDKIKGEPGEKGEAGEQGMPGKNGIHGHDGADGQDADVEQIVATVLEAMKGTEKKLSINDLDGVDAFTQRLRSSLNRDSFLFNGKRIRFEELMHGGGSSTGGTGLVYLPASGLVNNVNTVFTFTKTPTFVIVNGASYVNGSGVTIAGTTATLDNPPGNGGSVTGLG